MRGLGWTAAAVMLSGGLVAPAASQGIRDTHFTGGACFERVYDPAHLKAHPQQTVRRFFLGGTGPEWVLDPGQFALDFGFELVGSLDVYTGIAICVPAGANADCHVEGDGGSFVVEPNGGGLRIRVARLQAEGPRDVSPDLAAADNRVMLLYPAAPRTCRTF